MLPIWFLLRLKYSQHSSVVGLDIKFELAKKYLFSDLFESGMDCQDFEVELVDNMPVVQDKLVSILHAINMDVDMDKFEDSEEELFASAD